MVQSKCSDSKEEWCIRRGCEQSNSKASWSTENPVDACLENCSSQVSATVIFWDSLPCVLAGYILHGLTPWLALFGLQGFPWWSSTLGHLWFSGVYTMSLMILSQLHRSPVDRGPKGIPRLPMCLASQAFHKKFKIVEPVMNEAQSTSELPSIHFSIVPVQGTWILVMVLRSTTARSLILTLHMLLFCGNYGSVLFCFVCLSFQSF